MYGEIRSALAIWNGRRHRQRRRRQEETHFTPKELRIPLKSNAMRDTALYEGGGPLYWLLPSQQWSKRLPFRGINRMRYPEGPSWTPLSRPRLPDQF